MHDHAYYMRRAYEWALKGYNEGGCPIGAVLIDAEGNILGEGHNMRVQENNPILHGEMSAMRAAGARKNYAGTTMYTTLSPCMMCTGTMLQFHVPRVVIGDTVNSSGNAELLRSKGVEVIILDDPDCIALVRKFREEKPDLWLEDWGGDASGDALGK
jgi:creatinine deaminase